MESVLPLRTQILVDLLLLLVHLRLPPPPMLRLHDMLMPPPLEVITLLPLSMMLNTCSFSLNSMAAVLPALVRFTLLSVKVRVYMS